MEFAAKNLMDFLIESDAAQEANKKNPLCVSYWKEKTSKYLKKACFPPMALIDRPRDFCPEFISYIAVEICSDFIYSTWGNPEKIYSFPMEKCPTRIMDDMRQLRPDILFANVENELNDWRVFLLKSERESTFTNRDQLEERASKKEYRLVKQQHATESTLNMIKHFPLDFSQSDIKNIRESIRALRALCGGLTKIAVKERERPRGADGMHPILAEIDTVLNDVCDNFTILAEGITYAKDAAHQSESCSFSSGQRSARINYFVTDALKRLDETLLGWKIQYPKRNDEMYINSMEYFFTCVKVQFKVLQSLEDSHQIGDFHQKIMWKHQEIERLSNFIEKAKEAEGELQDIESALRIVFKNYQKKQMTELDSSSCANALSE